jgi:hypothetical protein
VLRSLARVASLDNTVVGFRLPDPPSLPPATIRIAAEHTFPSPFGSVVESGQTRGGGFGSCPF